MRRIDLLAYIAVFCILAPLGACSFLPNGILGDTFRNQPQLEIIENERYDPESGEPLKQGKIIDDRPIRVRQTVEVQQEDGTKLKKNITREIKITGSHYVPQPLPKKKEPKAEVVPVEKPAK